MLCVDNDLGGKGGDSWSEFGFMVNYLNATLNDTDIVTGGSGSGSFWDAVRTLSPLYFLPRALAMLTIMDNSCTTTSILGPRRGRRSMVDSAGCRRPSTRWSTT